MTIPYIFGTMPAGNVAASDLDANFAAVAAKLQQIVSVIDFGARGDNTGTPVGSAATGASWNIWPSWINSGNYLTKPGHDYSPATLASPPFTSSDTWDFVGIQLAIWYVIGSGGGKITLPNGIYVINRTLRVVQPTAGYGITIEGTHFKNCSIIPLATFSAPISGVGNPLLYFYRTGLSGAIVRNLNLTTYPLTGGTPAVITDQTIVGPNWESTGTYHSCIALNNADTVMFDGVFCNGYGEASIVALSSSSIWVNNFITEFQTISLVLRGSSNAYVNNPTFSSSSGTGASSWGTTGIYLNASAAYVLGGQALNLRGPFIYSTGLNNVFTVNGTNIATQGYGLLFRCLGLIQWQIDSCLMQYGQPNQTPIQLLDNQSTGSGDALNTADEGMQFTNNIVTNTGGVSVIDMMWVNGYNIQIRGNNFFANSTGSSGYVMHSLLNGAYSGAGTVNAILTDNIFRNFAMSNISIFGNIANNVDSNGSINGSWTPNQGGGLTVIGGFTSSGTYTKTGRVVTVQGQVNGATSVAVGANSAICSNLPFTASGMGTGGATNATGIAASLTYVLNNAIIDSVSAIGASASIYFTLTYLSAS